MKRFIFTLMMVAVLAYSANAQVIPSFQFGLKGGVDLTSLSTPNTFSSSNRAGYLGGFWARFGALGFNFQPEVYVTSKNVDIMSTETRGVTTDAKFTSIDVPLLFGGKVGAFGLGARFYTGPLISFSINKDQSFSQAATNVVRLNYQDQNFAWQFGAGVDIKSISIDLRYEAGISNQGYNITTDKSKVSLFNLSLAYKLFSL